MNSCQAMRKSLASLSATSGPGGKDVNLNGRPEACPHDRNIGIEHFRRAGILPSVKLLRAMLTMLLVALWPLATSHCSLEQLAGLDFLACADEAAAAPHQDQDCGTDSCASVESGCYKTEDASHVVPTPSLMASVLLNDLPLEAGPSGDASLTVLDFVPPELPNFWQFSLRTALPPRAPSLDS